MKKIYVITLILTIFVFTLISCDKAENPETEKPSSENTNTESEENQDESDNSNTEGAEGEFDKSDIIASDSGHKYVY